jgi:hypothetical protein
LAEGQKINHTSEDEKYTFEQDVEDPEQKYSS